MGRKLLEEYNIDQGPIRIGRQAEAQIVLDHQSISRKHAVITKEGAQWAIQIEDGKNGLFVNGHFTTRSELNNGDRIEIGRYVILFVDTPRAISLEQEDGIGLDEDWSDENAIINEDGSISGDDPNPQRRPLDQLTVTMKLSDLKRVHEQNQNVMEPHLTWFEDQSKRVVALKDLKILIGKSDDCQIQLTGGFPGVKHVAIISKFSGNFYLEPLSRFAAIKKNGEIIKETTVLEDGDRLQIFNHTLQFHGPMG